MNQLQKLTNIHNNINEECTVSTTTTSEDIRLPFNIMSVKEVCASATRNDVLFYTEMGNQFTKGFVCFERYLVGGTDFYNIRMGTPDICVRFDLRHTGITHDRSVSGYGYHGMPHMLNSSFCLGNAGSIYNTLKTGDPESDLKIRLKVYSDSLYHRNIDDPAGRQIRKDSMLSLFKTADRGNIKIYKPLVDHLEVLFSIFGTNSFKCINGTDEDVFLDYIAPFGTFDGDVIVPNIDLSKIDARYLQRFGISIFIPQKKIVGEVTELENSFKVCTGDGYSYLTIFDDVIYLTRSVRNGNIQTHRNKHIEVYNEIRGIVTAEVVEEVVEEVVNNTNELPECTIPTTLHGVNVLGEVTWDHEGYREGRTNISRIIVLDEIPQVSDSILHGAYYYVGTSVHDISSFIQYNSERYWEVDTPTRTIPVSIARP